MLPPPHTGLRHPVEEAQAALQGLTLHAPSGRLLGEPARPPFRRPQLWEEGRDTAAALAGVGPRDAFGLTAERQVRVLACVCACRAERCWGPAGRGQPNA